ncbi:MAG: type VII toxin-antitoxin system HepT family RNase toxin, partial [Gemmatimonadota bacterium]
MTRDVIARKLARLRVYLADLAPHAGKSTERILDDRYEIERLLELLVQVAVDIVSHELAERGVVPDSYRGAFLAAATERLLPADLAGRLADAAGLRNILVHLYEEIDYEIVAGSIAEALGDFGQFAELYAARLDEERNS